MRNPGAKRPPALVLCAVAVALVALAPAFYLILRQGFNLRLMLSELGMPSTWPLIRQTVTLLLGVCLLTGALGTGLAVLVTRTDLPARKLWVVLFTLPLGVPTFVGSYAWVAFSYRYFPASRQLAGLGGATLVLTLSLYPYVFLPVMAALRHLPSTQEEVARALGHRPSYIFFRITLPQLRQAIATGLLIIALHILAEYGAVEMLNYQTLTTSIVQRVTVLGEPESARALAVVLALAAALLLIADRAIRGRVYPLQTGQGTPRAPIIWRTGRGKPLWLLACAAVVMAALAVPLRMTLGGVLEHLFSRVDNFDSQALWQSSFNTIKWSGWAAALGTLCALPISLLVVRWAGRLSLIIERSIWLAHALPGVIMALSLVYVSAKWLHPLYQSSLLLVLGYVVMYLPLAVGAQQVGIAQASVQLEEVSRSLGRGPLSTFGRVTMPLSLPAIGIGALLVALDAAKELTTTLLLRPTGEHTLATRLWVTTEGEVLDFISAAPYGLALLIIGAVPAFLLARATLKRL